MYQKKTHKDKMGLKNNFTEETRELFIFNYICWWCSRSHVNCLHHILGRVSNSPLNVAPLNNFSCHIGNGQLSQFATKSILLKKTLKFLIDADYKLTKKDKEFMKENSKYYE